MPQLKQYDKRMLRLLADAKHEGKVRTDREWGDKIGISFTNLSAAKAGRRSFSLEQIIAAAKFSGVSVDWIVGLSKTKTLKKQPNLKDLLTQAIDQIDSKVQ